MSFSEIKIDLTLKKSNILYFFNPIALRKAKIVYNFGISECNRVKSRPLSGRVSLQREANKKAQKLSPFRTKAKI